MFPWCPISLSQTDCYFTHTKSYIVKIHCPFSMHTHTHTNWCNPISKVTIKYKHITEPENCNHIFDATSKKKFTIKK